MISALTRYTIQQLRTAGVAQQAVAEQCGVSERSVRRIEQEPRVENPVSKLVRPVGRPSKTARFRTWAAAELEADPTLRGIELLRRAKLKGYSGGKSAFLAMIRQVRKPAVRFTSRFEGVAGEFSQHDFGQVQVRFVDGSTQLVRFFASRLKWSRYAAVSLVPNETAETLVRTTLEHFEALGGVPKLAVFDRPKTVALKWAKNGHITEWNPVFAQAAMDIGFTAEVCWAYSPNQKGSVENIVGWVKGSFFKQRTFLDLDDLEAQLTDWLHETNEQRPSRATKIIPAVRRQEELPRLRAPRITSDALAIRRPVVVASTGYVVFEGRELSMLPELCGRTGTIYVHADRLRVVIGKHEEIFCREGAPRVTKAEHRAARLKVLAARGRLYAARQHLLDLGPACEAFLTELCHRSEDQAPGVQRLHELLEHHGDQALTHAIRQAVAAQNYTLGYVEALLPAIHKEAA